MAQPINACHVHYLRKERKRQVHAPPTEALAIRTIAQRNTSFTLNNIACRLCCHSVPQAGPNRPGVTRAHQPVRLPGERAKGAPAPPGLRSEERATREG